jgi:hypothetical protein
VKIEEPTIKQSNNPEKSLQEALFTYLSDFGKEREIDYVILKEFGLDIAVFYNKSGIPSSRFIEVKTYVGSRQGGVGIGNSQGNGIQVDLLLHSHEKLALFDNSILWVLGYGLQPIGSARYKIFSSVDAKNAAMSGVKRGKQNNLKISALSNDLVTWEELLTRVSRFVFD